MRGHGHAERHAILVDHCGGARAYPGLAEERLALVAEDEVSVDYATVVTALLGKGVLHLEQVGKVAPGLDSDLEVGRLAAVVQHPELLVEAVRDLAQPDHGEVGVDVHVGGAGYQEEPRLEVL